MERNYYKTYQKYMIFFAAVIVSLIILPENRVRSSAWKIRMSEGRMESGLNEKLKRRKKKTLVSARTHPLNLNSALDAKPRNRVNRRIHT